MKWLKYVGFSVLAIALFICGFAGGYFLFRQGSFDYDIKNLSKYDSPDSTYYLKNAPRDIAFRVTLESADTECSYSVVDDAGVQINNSIKKTDDTSVNILPPRAKYAPGEFYTLTLGEGVSFKDDNLRNARVLVFCIEQDEVEHYAYTPAVKETEATLELDESGALDVSAVSNAAVGDILLGNTQDGELMAYKVTALNENGTAQIEIPSLDEIFSELDVHGDYTWDAHAIANDPDIRDEVASNFRQSDFYNALLMTAYAEEKQFFDGKIIVDIEEANYKTIDVTIVVSLEPGDNGLFGMQELRHQAISLTFKRRIALDIHTTIKKLGDLKDKWDISATLESTMAWSLNISIYKFDDEDVDDDGLDEDVSDVLERIARFAGVGISDYYKKVGDILKKLNAIKTDNTNGSLEIFGHTVKIPNIPGMYFDIELEFIFEFELAADITISDSLSTVYSIGLCYRDKKLESYYSFPTTHSDYNLSLKGKAEFKAAVQLPIKAKFISDKIAYIQIAPQMGLYADVYATLPIGSIDSLSEQELIYSYFEFGGFMALTYEAELNYFFGKLDFEGTVAEKKDPWLTLGNEKIAIELFSNHDSIRAVGNKANAPDIIFRYYDAPAGTEATEIIKIDNNRLSFHIDKNTKLEVDGEQLVLPSIITSDTLYVTASYNHTDGRTYSTLFKITVAGSIIEGKVSAYTDDASRGEISGATVNIYSAQNPDTLIASTETHEDGSFSFNVPAGDYVLTISADGYKTLISQQSVGESEIKYTEHILLIDDAQSGNGAAGGKVTNSLNAEGMSGVVLRFRENWNNHDGDYFGNYTVTTDENGRYTIDSLPVGYYTIEASLDGFVTEYKNIIVMSENAKLDYDFTITPHLPDDVIRIVLTWGQTPADLDSHLIGTDSSGSSFEVSYKDKTHSLDGNVIINLDVDVIHSYGPETVTILQLSESGYTYFVHDYTNRSSSSSTEMSFSGATVKVYKGNSQIDEFHVPTDRVGNHWTVFKIDKNGNIIPQNTVSNMG